MIIEDGQASVEIIEKELRHLFREVPKWTIKKMSADNEYMISFPNEDIRYQCSRFSGFKFDTAPITAKVIHTELSPDADGKLEVVWVKAYNFPDIARKGDIVMEVAYVVGDPEEVDIISLNSRGPVRVKIACREVSKIRGETQVFFNGERRRIRWDPEEPKTSFKEPRSSKFDRQGDRDNDEEEEEDNFEKDPSFGEETGGKSQETLNNLFGNSGKTGGVGFKQNKDLGLEELSAQFLDEQKSDQMQIEQGVVTTLERSKNPFAQKYPGLKESVDVTPKTIEGCVAIRPYDLSSGSGESRLEEGEIEFSQTAGGAGEDMLMDLSQHSSIGSDVTEDGAGEEELLDYEEDPSVLAQIQMADLERKVEERATKLIEDKKSLCQG
jgi:hypothetical protein